MRRAKYGVIGVLALGLVFLAGCGKSSNPQTTPSSAPPTTAAQDPVAILRGAMLTSITTTMHMDGKITTSGQTLNLTADTDAVARSMTMSMTGPLTMDARVIGTDFYVKVAGLGSKPWIHLDMTKLPATSSLRQSTDFASQLGIMGGVVSADPLGDGRYKGVADLDKAAKAAGEGMRANLEAAAAQATNAGSVPFEATVNSDGKLTELSYTLQTKAAGEVRTELKLSKFGEPISVAKPSASETEEASADLYSRL